MSYTPIVVKKQKPLATKTWRPTFEDAKLFEELKSKLGIVNDSDLVRMGLRALAEKEARATNG